MKVGDRGYCYNEITKINKFTIGKFYIIKEIMMMKRNINYIIVYDDTYSRAGFSIDGDVLSVNHYSNYFYTEKEIRKMKLEKIEINL